MHVYAGRYAVTGVGEACIWCTVRWCIWEGISRWYHMERYVCVAVLYLVVHTTWYTCTVCCMQYDAIPCMYPSGWWTQYTYCATAQYRATHPQHTTASQYHPVYSLPSCQHLPSWSNHVISVLYVHSDSLVCAALRRRKPQTLRHHLHPC